MSFEGGALVAEPTPAERAARRKAFHAEIEAKAAALAEPAGFEGDIDAPIRGGLPWLKEDVQRLVDRIEELQGLLGTGNDDVSRIRAALGITPQASEIVGFMLNRAVATRDAIYIMLFGDRPECDQPEMKIVDVQLCRARKALKRHGIVIRADWGLGSWSFSSEGKAKLRALMAAVD